MSNFSDENRREEFFKHTIHSISKKIVTLWSHLNPTSFLEVHTLFHTKFLPNFYTKNFPPRHGENSGGIIHLSEISVGSRHLQTQLEILWGYQEWKVCDDI